MKKFVHRITFALAAAALAAAPFVSFAGNDTKKGAAGATELLINPWARSTGMAGANTAGVRGVESFNTNIAGLAYTNGTELQLAGTRYLSGTNISITALGFAQKMGGGGTLGISVMSMNLGDFIETTYSSPEGTGNLFSPNYFNVGAAYSQIFSQHVTGGICIRVVSHTLPRATATDFGIDAGVQYRSLDGKFKFGVAMRNWGPKTNYSGSGFIVKGTILT